MSYPDLKNTTRRHFLKDCSTGLGGMWLANQMASASPLSIQHDSSAPLAPLLPQMSPKVKRVIYLHMIGAPSQLELFDYKPELKKYDGKDCPQEFLEGQRFAFIQGTPQMLGPVYPFKQHGDSGAWISDRLPELSKHADKLTFIKTMTTDQFNHGPAQLWFTPVKPGLAIRPSALGLLGGWGRKTKTCLASWFSFPVGESHVSENLSGAPASFLLFIKVCNVAPSVIPFSIRRTKKVSPGNPVVLPLTLFRTSIMKLTLRWATPKQSRASRNMKWPSVCRFSFLR
jgi:hypothetical protein